MRKMPGFAANPGKLGKPVYSNLPIGTEFL